MMRNAIGLLSVVWGKRKSAPSNATPRVSAQSEMNDLTPDQEQEFKDLSEALRDKTNDRFDEFVRRQKIIERLK
jgi:hypothetical protein